MILGIIIGVLLSSGILYAILIPKVKHQEEINAEIVQQNEQAKHDYELSKHSLGVIEGDIKIARAQVENLEEKRCHLIDLIEEQEEQNRKYFESNKENIQLKFNNYQKELNNEYLELAKDLVADFSQKILHEKEKTDNFHQLSLEAEEQLKGLREKVNAAVEASKRAEEIQTKQDFYRVVISDEDLTEIAELKEVATRLRNAEPLNKVIWSVYYQKPTNEMIGRVLGSETKTGIYKITNLQTGKCYVGQTVNAASRWKQHIKRALGAETPTRNKLYPIMASTGVENWSFELLEECSAEKLDQQEDFWQEYFHAIDWGYSIK